MAGFAIRGKVDVAEVVKRLQGIKAGTQNRILRGGVRKATSIVNKAAKASCPVDTTTHGLLVRGLLKKSIGVKMAGKRGRVVGVVGPRRGFKQQVRTQTPGFFRRLFGRAGRPVYQDPANIAHLVEYGHGGPHPAPPHPFMRPAWDGSRRSAERAIADHAEAELAKMARGS